MRMRTLLSSLALYTLTLSSASAAFGGPGPDGALSEIDACRLAVGCEVRVALDGRPLLVEREVSPDASRVDAMAPPAALSATGPDDFSRRWDRRREFGNRFLGAYVQGEAGVSYTGILGGLLRADARGVIGGRLVGARPSLVEARVEGTVSFRVPPFGGGASTAVSIAGRDVYSRSWAPETEVSRTLSYPRVFARANVPVFGLITVRLRLVGTAGVEFSSRLTDDGVALEVAPTAGIDAVGGIAGSVGLAAAGVDGEVMLVDGSLPLTAEISVAGDDLEWALEAAARLRTLYGRIVAFAEVDLIFWRVRKEKVLADWDGFEWDRVLLHIGS